MHCGITFVAVFRFKFVSWTLGFVPHC